MTHKPSHYFTTLEVLNVFYDTYDISPTKTTKNIRISLHNAFQNFQKRDLKAQTHAIFPSRLEYPRASIMHLPSRVEHMMAMILAQKILIPS